MPGRRGRPYWYRRYRRRRRGLRSRIQDWVQRHPFASLLIGAVVVAGMIWMEAARIEAARYTVAYGWGTGVAAGVLASLGLTALCAVVHLATRGRPRLRAWTEWPLAVVAMVSWGICLRATTAPGPLTGARSP